MRSKKFIIILSAMLFLSLGISIFAFVSSPDEDTPVSSTATEIRVFKDISYGTHPNQTFDLNLPVGGNAEQGLVLFLHGGGWVGGNKESVKKSYPVFNANSDYATASINYRLVNDGESNIDDIIDDISLALKQIKSFASGCSVNLSKVVIGGHSAGGHLCLLYAYKYKDKSPIEVVGVLASAPVPDLSVESFYTDNTYGDEARMCTIISQLCGKSFTAETRRLETAVLEENSPINFVSDNAVPTIILHGSNDTIAPLFGSLMLTEELNKHSINNELVLFENAGHSMKNCEETRAYASELMLKTVKRWFGITTTE